MNNNYMYDAFISYRHCDLDQFVAENLHKQMETFKLPKSLIKKNIASRTKIERVFRDKEELPLTNNLEDPIMQALIHSEYLIVVCSPRLRESAWCKKEIETFIQYHGREKVLVVLAEGEPHDSFPEELLYVEEPVYYEDGSVKITKKMIEPLAADVRGKNKKEVLRNLKSELLRLLAPMFEVTYDDLRQRQRERKMKRIITASVTSAIVCLAIGIASTLAALHINKQKEKIEAQSAEIEAQADEILAQAEEIHAQSDEIREQNEVLSENQAVSLAADAMDLLNDDNRNGAIETALMALTEYEGITMPYTADAKYALTEALHVYNAGGSVKAMAQIDTEGIVEDIVLSPDRKHIVALDGEGRLIISDVTTGEEKGIIEDVADYVSGLTDFKNVAFLNDDKFVYVTYKGEICTYQISTGESKWENLDIVYATAIATDESGKYLALVTNDMVYIYETDGFTMKYSYEISDGYLRSRDMCFVGENTFVYAENTSSFTDSESQESIFHFVNLETGEAYAQTKLPYGSISLISSFNGEVYIAVCNLEDLFDSYGMFYKVNPVDGNVIWECSEAVYGDVVQFPFAEGATECLLVSAMSAYTVNMETGEATGEYVTANEINGVAAYKNKDMFLVITSTAEYCNINCEYDTMIVLEDYFLYNVDSKIDKVLVTEAGFAVLPQRENRVILYDTSLNPYMSEYTGQNLVLDTIDTQADYVEQAKELGIEKYRLVDVIISVPNEEIIFVKYNNDTLEVINKSTLEVIETVDGVKDNISMYLGKDNQGYTYISSGIHGYGFDENYHLVSRVDDLIKVDAENNYFIIGDADGDKYQIPIYTTEQLIQMAKDMLAQ